MSIEKGLVKKITYVGVFLALAALAVPALAWTGPTAAPPGGTVPALPVNIGSGGQTKSGPFTATGAGGGTGSITGTATTGYGVYGSSVSSWAAAFFNTSSNQGMYVQSPGSYDELAWNDGTTNWGVWTNGSIRATDIYDATSGRWLSAGGASGLPYGGGFGQYVSGGGCVDPNYAGGSGCGCPAYAPSGMGLGSGTCSGSACNFYLCY